MKPTASGTGHATQEPNGYVSSHATDRGSCVSEPVGASLFNAAQAPSAVDTSNMAVEPGVTKLSAEVGQLRQEMRCLSDAFQSLRREYQELRGSLTGQKGCSASGAGGGVIPVDLVESRIGPVSLSTCGSFGSFTPSGVRNADSYAVAGSLMPATSLGKVGDGNIIGSMLHQCMGVQKDLHRYEVMTTQQQALDFSPIPPPPPPLALTWQPGDHAPRHGVVAGDAPAQASDSRPESPPRSPVDAIEYAGTRNLAAMDLGPSPHKRESPMKTGFGSQPQRSRAKARAKGNAASAAATARVAVDVVDTDGVRESASGDAEEQAFTPPPRSSGKRITKRNGQAAPPTLAEALSRHQPSPRFGNFDSSVTSGSKLDAELERRPPSPQQLHKSTSFAPENDFAGAAQLPQREPLFSAQRQSSAARRSFSEGAMPRRSGDDSWLPPAAAKPLQLPFPEVDSFAE